MKIFVKKCDNGNGVFAGEKIHKGEIIINENSKIFSTENDVCETCFNIFDASGKTADKCVVCSRRFCSKKCRKSGKNLHNVSCSKINFDCMGRIIYRIYKYGCNGFCRFAGKLPHTYTYSAYIGKGTKILMNDWDDSLRVVMANVFRVKTCVLGDSIGYAIYPTASKINHSCDPNCVYFFQNGSIIVRAVRDIEPGGEVTISYIPMQYTLLDKIRRYNYIIDNIGFECKCSKCTSPELSPPDPEIIDFAGNVDYISIAGNKSGEICKDKCVAIMNFMKARDILVESIAIETIITLLLYYNMSDGKSEIDENNDTEIIKNGLKKMLKVALESQFGPNYLDYITQKELLLLA